MERNEAVNGVKEERRRGDAGMTLLELMFAAGVLAMTLSYLFGSLVGICMSGGLTESRAVASTHLSSVLEEVKSLPFQNLLQYEPPRFGNLGTEELIEVRCLAADGTLLPLPIEATVGSTLPNPLTVQCVVQWRDQRGFVLSKTASEVLYR